MTKNLLALGALWEPATAICARTGASRYLVRARLKGVPTKRVDGHQTYLRPEVLKVFPEGRWLPAKPLAEKLGKSLEALQKLAKRRGFTPHLVAGEPVYHEGLFAQLDLDAAGDVVDLATFAAGGYISLRTLQRLVHSSGLPPATWRGRVRYYPRAALAALLTERKSDAAEH
jgi:hypothetical protein